MSEDWESPRLTAAPGEEIPVQRVEAEEVFPGASCSEKLGEGLGDEWQEIRWKSGQVSDGQVLTVPG